MLLPSRLPGSELRQALVYSAAGLLAVTGLMSLGGLMPYDDPRISQYDHTAYLSMAENGPGAPGRASAPPYCWRVLVPFVASVIPLPLPGAFFAITFLALLGSSMTFYLLCRRAGMSHRWSLAGIASFMTYFWAVGFNLWDYLMVDAPALFLLSAGLLVLECREWSPFSRLGAVSAILVLGALTKEVFLALAAAVFVHEVRLRDGGLTSRAGRAILPLIPAFLAVLAVRAAIEADPSQMPEFDGYSLPSVFSTMLVGRLMSAPRWIAEALIDPWGPLLIVPILFNVRGALAWFRRHPHRMVLVAMAFLQTLVATSVGRLVIAALPVLGLYAMEATWKHLRQAARPAPALGGLLALQFLFQYLRRTTFGLAMPPYETTNLILGAYAVRGTAAIVFAAWWAALVPRTASRIGAASESVDAVQGGS